MAEQAKANPKQDKIYTIIGAIICIGFLIWLFSGVFTNKKSGNSENTASQPEYIEGTTITKSALEENCEDAKYGVNNGYDVIALSNYDFQTYDTGSYDKDGNLIIQAMWNGKKKSDNQTVKFWCYVSGKANENITVHYISVGNSEGRNDIWKTQKDLNANQYNKDGSPEYPELH